MKDLRNAIEILKKNNQLLEIDDHFSSDLEVSSFTNEVQKRNGPALLFKNVDDGKIPVLMNTFGNMSRLQLLLEKNIDDIISIFYNIVDLFYSKPSLLKGYEIFKDLKNLSPNLRESGPVKDMKDDLDLQNLPILKTWPKDGGKYITWPVVITRDPENGQYNAGVYRMQVYDGKTTGMHWQKQKTGNMHLMKAKKLGKTLDVAVAIGVHPSILFSSIAPLPEGMNELAFAGLLMGENVEVVKGETVDLYYPANAEIVLEGYVDPDEEKDEGPFGDHTGYYTPVEKYPVFHIKRIFHRKNLIYHATVVGKLWNEDVVIGDAIQRIFLPIIKFQNPEIVDLFLPEEGLFNDVAIISIDKKYPGQGRKVAMSILSMGQMMFTKYVIVVDKDINIRDRKEVMWAIATRTDPARDVEIIKLSVADSLDHASLFQNAGGKMIIDATNKDKNEGFFKTWPERIYDYNDDEINKKLKKYGLL
ncbi:MAG: menaquinone biosynthesis decarboxylase [Thermoplasmata archaeon]